MSIAPPFFYQLKEKLSFLKKIKYYFLGGRRYSELFMLLLFSVASILKFLFFEVIFSIFAIMALQ